MLGLWPGGEMVLRVGTPINPSYPSHQLYPSYLSLQLCLSYSGHQLNSSRTGHRLCPSYANHQLYASYLIQSSFIALSELSLFSQLYPSYSRHQLCSIRVELSESPAILVIRCIRAISSIRAIRVISSSSDSDGWSSHTAGQGQTRTECVIGSEWYADGGG